MFLKCNSLINGIQISSSGENLKWQRDMVKFVLGLSQDSKQPISPLKNTSKGHTLSWISPKPTQASSLLVTRSFWITIFTFPKGIPCWKRKQPTVTRSATDQAAGNSSQHTSGGQEETHWKTKRLLQTETLLLSFNTTAPGNSSHPPHL